MVVSKCYNIINKIQKAGIRMFNPYGGNPYSYPVMQQRLQSMEQQYPQQNQQGFYNGPMMQNYNYNNQQLLKGRAVTSFDEAKAAMIDLDGSIFIFPDISNKAIYTKQINLDGTASVNVYKLQQTEPNQNEQVNTDSQKDVSVIADDISTIKNMVAEMQTKIESIQQNQNNNWSNRKGVKNNECQSIPNDAANTK